MTNQPWKNTELNQDNQYNNETFETTDDNVGEYWVDFHKPRKNNYKSLFTNRNNQERYEDLDILTPEIKIVKPAPPKKIVLPKISLVPKKMRHLEKSDAPADRQKIHDAKLDMALKILKFTKSDRRRIGILHTKINSQTTLEELEALKETFKDRTIQTYIDVIANEFKTHQKHNTPKTWWYVKLTIRPAMLNIEKSMIKKAEEILKAKQIDIIQQRMNTQLTLL